MGEEGSGPAAIPAVIARWLFDHQIRQAALAVRLDMPRQFMNNILAGRRELPDDRIALLPDGLREPVADIRARRYEAMAALVRHSAVQTRGQIIDAVSGERAAVRPRA
ncbi:MAG TPA: hypothetical protein VGV37_04620 [Aliidongia sp.]|uniref:hypothetical protein n=1 Tax=Aliidongia sp. TaxID=1914230 RepID=UPI002DDC9CD4|nr:hypothetical protein [Aliidongia sp.]HEV2673802.1 hypothetical protein [Aliidongia sp.]